MPFALFCNDAQISKTYPSEADVWKVAQKSGLVVEAPKHHDRHGPRRVLDNDYEIKSCPAAPGEDPAQNKAEAERQSSIELQFNS